MVPLEAAAGGENWKIFPPKRPLSLSSSLLYLIKLRRHARFSIATVDQNIDVSNASMLSNVSSLNVLFQCFRRCDRRALSLEFQSYSESQTG